MELFIISTNLDYNNIYYMVYYLVLRDFVFC